jgi:hypothetical protein
MKDINQTPNKVSSADYLVVFLSLGIGLCCASMKLKAYCTVSFTIGDITVFAEKY